MKSAGKNVWVPRVIRRRMVRVITNGSNSGVKRLRGGKLKIKVGSPPEWLYVQEETSYIDPDGTKIPVLAAIASVPKRSHLLLKALKSLRPHVDLLYVYLNGFQKVPGFVYQLTDGWVIDPINRGAERKLYWAQEHNGIYLSCDDDFCYSKHYVCSMLTAIKKWNGKAIVTAHGRSYVGNPKNVHKIVPGSFGNLYASVRAGRWINHGGTGVMGWDARKIKVPTHWPQNNMCDMQVSIWAQENHIPMWQVPHPSASRGWGGFGWVHSLAMQGKDGLFRASQAEGHQKRNKLLQYHGESSGWVVFKIK